MTPATCTASCSGSGGVILCNGQVVFVADTIVDAGEWYIGHLDAQFSMDKFSIAASATCTGSDCVGKVSCATSPISEKTDGSGILLAGLAFAGLGAARRRRAPRAPRL